MKTLPLSAHSNRLLFSLAVLLVAITAVAQISETPPVTMGLWQTETTATVTGVENTPMAGMAAAMGRQHVSQSCLTAERWKSDIQGFNAKQQRDCRLSNLHQDSHEVSFDEVCSQGGSSTSHVDILIDSAEHAHGTVVMTVANPQFPKPMTVNVSMVTHYLGANCGDVKPGEAKMVR